MQVREYLPGLASTTSAGWASRLKSQGIVVPHLVQRPPAVQGRRADAADKTLRSSSGKFSLAQRKLVLFYLALQPIGCGRTDIMKPNLPYSVSALILVLTSSKIALQKHQNNAGYLWPC